MALQQQSTDESDKQRRSPHNKGHTCRRHWAWDRTLCVRIWFSSGTHINRSSHGVRAVGKWLSLSVGFGEEIVVYCSCKVEGSFILPNFIRFSCLDFIITVDITKVYRKSHLNPSKKWSVSSCKPMPCLILCYIVQKVESYCRCGAETKSNNPPI